MTVAALVHWAGVAGANALALFLVLLAALLATAALAWPVLHRLAVPRQESTLPQPLFLVVRAGLGFLLIVGGALLFVELAEALHAGDELAALDDAFTRGLHGQVPTPALHVFAALTRLANTSTLTALGVVVALVLVLRRRFALALGWALALGGNGLLSVTLKGVFRRVRPPHDDGLVTASGFSFPSGHSSGAVVAFGMLAYLALRFLPARWHLPAVLLATALAFSVGASRVFLRVHFASDVLAGFAAGLAWLAVCVTSIELTRAYRRRRASPA